MIKLKDILKNIKVLSSGNTVDIPVSGITADSRMVEAGFVFVAVKGHASDGHKFISQALKLGAVAIIVDNTDAVESGQPFFEVADSAEALGQLSHNYYGNPTHQLKLIGITGTNGKTTVATLLYELFQKLGYKTGLISTIQNKVDTAIIPSTHTTPDPVQLNALLAQMVSAGCMYAFMEVSSHAAHQKRIAGLKFSGAIFTNITHDHLDYHQTFDNYLAAKKSFFDGLPKDAFALVNADDKKSAIMLQNCKASHYTYSVKGPGDFMCRIIENNLTGLVLQLDREEFHSHLIGDFNAGNITAVYAAARLLNFKKEEILTNLSKLTPVEGRFDVVYSPLEGLTGIVDYAHTPDAVEKILSTINQTLSAHQSLITVIGCGGDRDKTKRPIMAKVAASLSTKAILTSDNPRSEQPETIIHEMEIGLDENLQKKSLSITDRKEAIKTAVMFAKKGDVICIAGKGHEKYQEIKGTKYPFDDKKILLETFKTLSR